MLNLDSVHICSRLQVHIWPQLALFFCQNKFLAQFYSCFLLIEVSHADSQTNMFLLDQLILGSFQMLRRNLESLLVRDVSKLTFVVLFTFTHHFLECAIYANCYTSICWTLSWSIYWLIRSKPSPTSDLYIISWWNWDLTLPWAGFWSKFFLLSSVQGTFSNHDASLICIVWNCLYIHW